jgi:hypothetical protein
MQNKTARARELAPQLRLVHPADAEAEPRPEAQLVPLEPALAVWRLQRASRTHPLPRELARRAISHYTDPDDLVLAPGRRGGELLEQAARLGRRALPLEPSAAGARAVRRAGARAAKTVVGLRPDQGAHLVLTPIPAQANERRLATLAATLLPLLRPGGFLAVAAAAPAADSSGGDGLGAIVRTCQRSGLQYWQHVVALTPAFGDGRKRGRSQRARPRAVQPSRITRCHHDLLVFRRPAEAEAVAAAAAGIAGVAA